MKYFRFFLLSSIGTLLCVSLGCNDSPDSVGKQPLSSSDNSYNGDIRVTTIDATEQPSLKNLIYTSTIDRFMVGKYLTYEAWACLKFYSWPDSLIGGKISRITSAEIKLRPFYHFGDSVQQINFKLSRAIANLRGDSLTFDSLNSYGNLYFDDNANTVSSLINPTDTTVCSIFVDTSVVRKWFISNADSIVDGKDINDGIILRPNSSPTAIIGFYSCNATDTSYVPTLYIHYVDNNGIPGTYVHKTGSSKYVGNSDLVLTNGKMYVQDGVSYRGLLALDNHVLDSLSLLWPLSIHRAIIQITLDSSSSSSRFTPFLNNRLYCLSVESNDKADGFFYTLSNQSTNSSIYQFDVTGMLSSWIKNTSIRKLTFSGSFESGSFDLFTFYGSGATIAQRPKLIITYSLKR